MRLLLARALDEAGLSARVKRQLPRQIWDAVVGVEIAQRAQPTVLASGVLHVLVQDHRWRDQLDAMRTELMRRLNARLGKALVREIRFGLAHQGALRARAAALPPDPIALHSARDLPEHLRCATCLGPELREAFLRAGTAAARASDGPG